MPILAGLFLVGSLAFVDWERHGAAALAIVGAVGAIELGCVALFYAIRVGVRRLNARAETSGLIARLYDLLPALLDSPHGRWPLYAVSYAVCFAPLAAAITVGITTRSAALGFLTLAALPAWMLVFVKLGVFGKP